MISRLNETKIAIHCPFIISLNFHPFILFGGHLESPVDLNMNVFGPWVETLLR